MTHLVHNSVLSSKQLVHREARQLGQRSPELWQEVSPAVAGLGQQAEAGDPAVSGAVHSAYGQRLAVCSYPAGLTLQVALEHWLQPSVQLWRDAHAALSGVYVLLLAAFLRLDMQTLIGSEMAICPSHYSIQTGRQLCCHDKQYDY